MAATSVNIEELFDSERFPQGLLIIPILVYFPFGLVLALVRLFIGLHTFLVACLLPKTASVRSFVLRTMCFVLGIVVHEGEQKHKNQNAKVVVTNHITVLDHLAVDLVLPCIMPSVWDLPKVLSWGLGFKDLGVKQGRDVLIQNAQRHCQDSDLPILAHPEGATTNGRVGLLKFSTWPFSIGEPITPVILEVKRPYLLNISPSVIGSRWWSDLLWFFFSPCTIFTIRYLPAMCLEDGTSEEEFTKRVQETMASALSLCATNYTCADKVEYLKRVLFQPVTQDRVTRPYTQNDVQLDRMAYQVKEVLPYVPVDAIKRDLIQTNNVSLTISNILEGAVLYVPESESTSSQLPHSSTSSSTESPSVKTAFTSCIESNGSNAIPNQYYTSLNTAALSFGKSATERMSSYQERKKRLIETARRRYMEKHGLS